MSVRNFDIKASKAVQSSKGLCDIVITQVLSQLSGGSSTHRLHLCSTTTHNICLCQKIKVAAILLLVIWLVMVRYLAGEGDVSAAPDSGQTCPKNVRIIMKQMMASTTFL